MIDELVGQQVPNKMIQVHSLPPEPYPGPTIKQNLQDRGLDRYNI